MSGFESAVAASLGSGVMNTVLGVVAQSARADAARAQADAQAQAAQAQLDARARAVAAQAERERAALALQKDSDDRKRRNLLERATARARASYGARGLSPSEGSAEALLAGVAGDFDAQQQERDGQFALQRAGLDQGLADSFESVDRQRAQIEAARGFARDRILLDQESATQNRIAGLLNWGLARLPR